MPENEFNQYIWAQEQPRVYGPSPLAISGTPMSEEDAAMVTKAEGMLRRIQQNPILNAAKQRVEQRKKAIADSKK